jgi:molybdopterin-guanine dinucleotide biosynthesis protein A
MGRDKALLEWKGATLVEWVARQVQEAAGSATLVGAPERYARLGLACIGERYEGCGPLSGIEAALREGGAELSLIVACDMPSLEVEVLKELLRAAQRSRKQVTAVRGPDGAPEPLCAVYHESALRSVEQALKEGRYRARNLLEELSLECLARAGAGIALNVNTPEEWEEIRRGAGA